MPVLSWETTDLQQREKDLERKLFPSDYLFLPLNCLLYLQKARQTNDHLQ